MEDFFFNNDAFNDFGLNRERFRSIRTMDKLNNGNIGYQQIGLESLSSKELLLDALSRLDNDMDVSFKRNIMLKSIIANKQHNLEVDDLPNINNQKVSSIVNIDELSSIHVEIKNEDIQYIVGTRGWPPKQVGLSIVEENKHLETYLEISEDDLDSLILKISGKPGWEKI